jgi:hypothetical protein
MSNMGQFTTKFPPANRLLPHTQPAQLKMTFTFQARRSALFFTTGASPSDAIRGNRSLSPWFHFIRGRPKDLCIFRGRSLRWPRGTGPPAEVKRANIHVLAALILRFSAARHVRVGGFATCPAEPGWEAATFLACLATSRVGAAVQQVPTARLLLQPVYETELVECPPGEGVK